MHKFILYLKQRFPVLPLLLFSLLTSLAIAQTTAPVTLPMLVAQMLLLTSFLFHLRILDEYKDEAYDAHHHPERPLQQQHVSHGDLIFYGLLNAVLLSGAAQIALSSPLSTVLFYSAWIYTFLMFREFGIKDFWEKHSIWYVVSHEVCLVLLYLSLFAAQAPTLSLQLLPHLVFIFIPMLLIELGRKIKHRIDPSGVPTSDTYAAKWGQERTILVTALLPLVGIVPLALTGLASSSMTVALVLCVSAFTAITRLARAWFIEHSLVVTALYSLLLLLVYILWQ